jgi:hypothetical protein
MLSRDTTRAKHTLQLRNIQPKYCHSEGKRDSWEEVEILRDLVEGWWVLED